MTCHYPDLARAFDWSCCEDNLLQPIRSTTQNWVETHHQYGISVALLRHHIVRKPWRHCKMLAFFSSLRSYSRRKCPKLKSVHIPLSRSTRRGISHACHLRWFLYSKKTKTGSLFEPEHTKRDKEQCRINKATITFSFHFQSILAAFSLSQLPFLVQGVLPHASSILAFLSPFLPLPFSPSPVF